MPAKMVGANLKWADLTEAKFPSSDLTDASLHEAILTGADLRGRAYWIDHAGHHEGELGAAQITQKQLDEAVADPERPLKLSDRPAGNTERMKRLVWRGEALTE